MTTPINLSKYEQLKATGDLPSPKGAALAIIQQSQRDDASIGDMVRVVKGDPAFVGRILKAANSAQFGAHRPVASINDALMVLGMPAIRGLALSFSLLSENRMGHCRGFDYARFWSGSLAAAVAFQALVGHLHSAPPEECFTIGLLSRIGELALATIYPAQYAALLAESQPSESRQDRLKREQDAFAINHSEMTAAMMVDWGLPRAYVDPVLRFENAEQAGLVDGSRPYILTWTLVLAHQIAEICLAEENARAGLMTPLVRLGSQLSIEADVLSGLCDAVAKEWLAWGALLDVKARQLPSFSEMATPSLPDVADPNPVASGKEGKRIRVLVVEDDLTQRDAIRNFLAQNGYEVYQASNGRQGLELALEVQPRIMLVDWQMPLLSGLELIQSLRKTKLGRSIYILLLSEEESDEQLVKAFDAGADDLMTKPIKPRVLAARLRTGQRLIHLQDEVEHDREEIRRFAAELAISNRRLHEAALTDALTGFPNRRYAMERLEQEWAGAVRSKRPLSCMVVDLDGFKGINDNYGHDIGDLVLKQAALALKSGLRVQDVVARIGGDEFLVICPDTALASVMACAERVRASVEAIRIEVGRISLSVTVSIGVAIRESDTESTDTLVKRADQGLYVAKEQGRNRVGMINSRAKVVQAPKADA